MNRFVHGRAQTTLARVKPIDRSIYTWDEKARVFRDSEDKAVERERVRASLDRYLDTLQEEIQRVTQELVDGNRTISSWQLSMEGIIKRSHVAAAGIAKGGHKQADRNDWLRVGRIVKEQYAYLQRFARQLEDGRPVDGRTISRAKMYGLAATGTYERILRDGDLAAGYDQERRLLHSLESCPECLTYNAGAAPGNDLGWQPAGMLPNIGEASSCLTRCRCTFQRRKTSDLKKKRVRKPRVKIVKPPPPPKAPEPPPKAPEPPKPQPDDYRGRLAQAAQRQREANAREARKPGASFTYQRLQGKYPDLIPPGKIEERIKAYAIGDEKVKIAVAIGDRYRRQFDELDSRRMALNAELMGMQDRMGKLQKPYPTANKEKRADISAKVNAMQIEFDRKVLERNEARDRLNGMKKQERDEIHGHFKVTDQASLMGRQAYYGMKTKEGDTLVPLDPTTQQNADSAIAWLNQMTARSTNSSVSIPLGMRPGQRAYCKGNGDHIALGMHENEDVIVHEFGHAIEFQFSNTPYPDDSVMARSLEFLKYRTGNEPIRKLNDVLGGTAYRDDEEGQSDRFEEAFGDQKWYVGKSYKGQATEVLAMGLQKFYTEPAEFARRDPEYFRFVCGVLDGSLR